MSEPPRPNPDPATVPMEVTLNVSVIDAEGVRHVTRGNALSRVPPEITLPLLSDVRQAATGGVIRLTGPHYGKIFEIPLESLDQFAGDCSLLMEFFTSPIGGPLPVGPGDS